MPSVRVSRFIYRDVSRTNFNTQYKNPNRTVIARTEDAAMAMYWLIFLNVHFFLDKKTNQKNQDYRLLS
jgi:hypothetical protein